MKTIGRRGDTERQYNCERASFECIVGGGGTRRRGRR
jgi:hypothetical protein